MKINIEVDCTPDEARRFFGLPEIAPMQERLMQDIEQRLRDAVKNGDVKPMLEQWLPFATGSIDHWQNMWSQMATAATGLQKAAKAGKPEGKG